MLHRSSLSGREGGDNLSVDQCLALRVEKLETKNQYRKEFEYLKQQGKNILCSPTSLDAKENEYLPPAARWSIIGQEHVEHLHHTPAKLKRTTDTSVANSLGGTSFDPIDILRDFPVNSPEMLTPNCKGVRWSYPDALAQTLMELDSAISSGLSKSRLDADNKDVVIQTIVKDGADGMREVAIHKETSHQFLPDKAFRFSFAVLQCSVLVGDQRICVFREENPNSVRVNRPLLEAIADENHRASSAVCMTEIECERSYMKDNLLKVHIPEKGFGRLHEIKFYTSMIDEKFDRKEGGLAGSGSLYMCTLCEATRETAKSDIGSFVISRSLAGMRRAAELRRLNLENLSENVLNEATKGVKSRPLLQSEPRDRGIDATC